MSFISGTNRAMMTSFLFSCMMESIMSESASCFAVLTAFVSPSSSVKCPPVIWDKRSSFVRTFTADTSEVASSANDSFSICRYSFMAFGSSSTLRTSSTISGKSKHSAFVTRNAMECRRFKKSSLIHFLKTGVCPP